MHGDADLRGLVHKSIALGHATTEKVLGVEDFMKSYLVLLYSIPT